MKPLTAFLLPWNFCICIFNFLSLWKEIKNFKNTIAVARIYEYFFSMYRWNRPIMLSYWMLGYILAMSSQDLIKSPSPNFIMLALWTQVTFKSKRMNDLIRKPRQLYHFLSRRLHFLAFFDRVRTLVSTFTVVIGGIFWQPTHP